MTVLFLYLRLTLGLLFVVAGLSKARDHRAFYRAVAGFQIVSPLHVQRIAVAIVSLELVGGGLLLLGTHEWLGAILVGSLLAAFNAALIVNLLRGRRNLDCGCFGTHTARIGWGHVTQNTLLFLMAMLVGVLALWANPPRGSANPSGGLTVLAAIYTIVIFLAAQELVSVRAGLRRMLNRIQTE